MPKATMPYVISYNPPPNKLKSMTTVTILWFVLLAGVKSMTTVTINTTVTMLWFVLQQGQVYDNSDDIMICPSTKSSQSVTTMHGNAI